MSQIWIRDEECVPSRQEFSLTQVLGSLFSLYISPTTTKNNGNNNRKNGYEIIHIINFFRCLSGIMLSANMAAL